MSTYLRIREWKKFQHYRDRNPPWVKLHRELLTSRTWVSLDDASRVLAIACMLLAAGTDNKIPADADYLKRVAYLNGEPDWSKLVETQFIDIVDENGEMLAPASTPLAKRTECLIRDRDRDRDRDRADTTAAAPPTRKRSPILRKRADEPLWFIEFRGVYPQRAGDQAWRKAMKAAHARMAEGHTPQDFIAGARRYAAFCDATAKTGSEYVKQAATFLGPDKPFLLPWHAPPRLETASERVLRALNGTDDDRTIDHETIREPIAIARQ